RPGRKPISPILPRRVHQTVIEGENHGRGPVTQVQLGEHPADVRLHRALTQVQGQGDLAAAQAGADQREHLALAAAQHGPGGAPGTARSRRVAVVPSTSGMRTSITTTSGRKRFTASTTPAPSPSSPTISKP